jgi:DNA (cytosine-5)-methyltransferase 1
MAHSPAKPCSVPVFGEQVASKPGLAWLDLVHADLEGQGYAVGAVDLCAAGVGAPHIRQRLWFVAYADGDFSETGRGCEAGAVVDTSSEQAWVPRRARVDGITQGFWSDADWIPCVDEKWRPVESGTFPLAHGAPARMGRLRGYGNAIVSEAAATFIKAASDI